MAKKNSIKSSSTSQYSMSNENIKNTKNIGSEKRDYKVL